MALTLTILLSSSPLSLSQPSPPATRQTLIEQIEARAVNHAQAGAVMYPDSVYTEFKDNPFNLDRTAILDIYEASFIAEQERLKGDLWEQLPVSWIVAGILLILLIFRDVLQEKLTQVTNTIWDWTYQHIAGNPLFRTLALQNYQQCLQDRLKTLDTPFKITPPLAMADVYVPLKVKAVADADLPRSGERPFSQGDEFDIYAAMARHTRLMVVGPPGSGKSVLLKHIAFTYSEGRLDLPGQTLPGRGLPGQNLLGQNPPGQPIPLRLELNRLRDPELDEARFVAKLVEGLSDNGFPNARHFVRQGLETGQLLLLLDGLDEVPSEIRDNVVTTINQVLRKYDRCRTIITCRTAVYEHEFDVALNRNLLEVVEFTDPQMRHFLQAWAARMPADKSVEQLMQTLQDRPKIKTLARNPLLLTIITYLYSETTFVLPHSRAEFYEKATDMLLELRDQERNIPNRYSAKAKRQILRRLALTVQDTLDPTHPDRRSLPHTAVRQQVQQLLPDLDLAGEKTEPILEEIIRRSGLLLEIDSGERYQFAHLTLQEFFAAAALQNQAEGLMRRFQQDTTTWREVVKLWCGQAGNSTNLIREIYNRDALLAFECLADAPEVDRTLATEIIEYMQRQLPTAATLDAVARAFGAVAADVKPRGKTVLRFLQTQLNTAPDPETRQAAANALSMTNLPSAARMLAERYQQNRHVPLLRMGDLAVKPLVEIAQQGSVEAIDDLSRLKTPAAVRALVLLLWYEDDTLASRAAWRLAERLPQPSTEATLSALKDLPSVRSTPLVWIWSPFEDANGSPLAVIAGRMAQLMAAHPDPPPFVWPDGTAIVSRSADPRLLVPLCALEANPVETIKVEKQDIEAIEALLESGNPESQLFQDKSQALADRLVTPANRMSPWGRLLTALPPDLQLELLYRLATAHHRPEQRDWVNLLRPTSAFQFAQSWIYRAILVMALLASAAAVLQLFWTMVQHPKHILIQSAGAIAIVVVILFWGSVLQGIANRLEPLVFHKLGPLGVVNFASEIRHLFVHDPLWQGVKLVSLIKKSGAMAWFLMGFMVVVGLGTAVAVWTGTGGKTVVGFGALAVVGSGVWTIFFGESGEDGGEFLVLIATVFVSVAGAVAIVATPAAAVVAAAAGVAAVVAAAAFFALNKLRTDAWLWVGLIALVVAMVGTLAVAMAVAGIVTVAMTVVAVFLCSYGIKVLRSAYESQQKELTLIPFWHKFLALFALPYFCWFPIVAGFSLLGLYALLQRFNLPNAGVIPWGNWPLALTIWLGLFGICCLLWVYGQRKERAARNPLQGILDRYYPQYKQRAR